MNKQKIQELIVQRQEQRADIYKVERDGLNSFKINGHPYELLVDYKDAFEPSKLADRFSTILSKYDYIVGDWGFDQLRLKGFYAEKNATNQPGQIVDTIQDYLYEYCNFGCAYFVIQNLDVQVVKPEHSRRHHSRRGTGSSKGVNNHHANERRSDSKRSGSDDHGHPTQRQNSKPKKKKKSNTNTNNHKSPQIRERHTKVNPLPVGKRPEHEAVRTSDRKKQRFVIRHK